MAATTTKQQRTRGADYPEPSGVPKIARRRGAPSLFMPDRIEQVRNLALGGYTAVEIADQLGVAVSTMYGWGVEHPEILEALKAGREAATDRVEKRLYHKAAVEGDNTAMIFWLKNRRPQEWNDRKEVNLSGAVETSGATDVRALALAVIALLQEADGEENLPITIEHQQAAE